MCRKSGGEDMRLGSHKNGQGRERTVFFSSQTHASRFPRYISSSAISVKKFDDFAALVILSSVRPGKEGTHPISRRKCERGSSQGSRCQLRWSYLTASGLFPPFPSVGANFGANRNPHFKIKEKKNQTTELRVVGTDMCSPTRERSP